MCGTCSIEDFGGDVDGDGRISRAECEDYPSAAFTARHARTSARGRAGSSPHFLCPHMSKILSDTRQVIQS